MNLNQFSTLLGQVKAMGGMQTIMALVPGIKDKLGPMADQLDDAMIIKIQAVIAAFTPEQREDPSTIDEPAKASAAEAADVTTDQVDQLLQQFEKIKDVAGGMMGF